MKVILGYENENVIYNIKTFEKLVRLINFKNNIKCKIDRFYVINATSETQTYLANLIKSYSLNYELSGNLDSAPRHVIQKYNQKDSNFNRLIESIKELKQF